MFHCTSLTSFQGKNHRERSRCCFPSFLYDPILFVHFEIASAQNDRNYYYHYEFHINSSDKNKSQPNVTTIVYLWVHNTRIDTELK